MFRRADESSVVGVLVEQLIAEVTSDDGAQVKVDVVERIDDFADVDDVL